MLRVIQWATGNVGRHAVAAVHAHPDLELVGGLVYSEAKAGRDLGDIAGIGRIGIAATTDRDSIVDLEADCVVYAPQGEMDPMGALDDICRLLAAGKNVVSTAVTADIHPASAGPEVAGRLQAACAAGGTSFHGTGIEPGWAAEVLPLMFDVMGFGLPPDAPVPMADAGLVGTTFRAPLTLLAEGLGATVERFEYRRDVAVAKAPLQVAAGVIEAGTVSAQRFGYTAVVHGRPALTVEHVTRMGPDEAPDWPTGRGWRVTVEGTPSMVLDCRIAVHGEDDTDQGCLATAMHAVHAIAPVCAAEPGIRTFLDLPMIVGRGVLTPD